jgi:hypothetical protein
MIRLVWSWDVAVKRNAPLSTLQGLIEIRQASPCGARLAGLVRGNEARSARDRLGDVRYPTENPTLRLGDISLCVYL